MKKKLSLDKLEIRSFVPDKAGVKGGMEPDTFTRIPKTLDSCNDYCKGPDPYPDPQPQPTDVKPDILYTARCRLFLKINFVKDYAVMVSCAMAVFLIGQAIL